MNPQHFTVVEMQHNRAEFEYLHNGAAGISTAFEIKEKAEIKLNIPRALGTTCAYMEIYDENATRFILEIEGEWQGIDGKYAVTWISSLMSPASANGRSASWIAVAKHPGLATS